MGRPTTVTVHASGEASAWIPLDRHISPFNIGFQVVVAGEMNYRVQHTLNDVIGGETATAFTHVDVSSATTNRDGNYAYPISAMRILVNSASSQACSARLTLIQAGVD